jgi:CheY-like chemotaxis protein
MTNTLTAPPPRRAAPEPAVLMHAARADGCIAPAHPVLVIDADPLSRGLLDEWLGECGCAPSHAGHDERALAPAAGRFELLVVDIPYPRQGGPELLQRLASEHPGTPIVALSPTFFGSVGCTGALARTLGVARVLPKPLSREALLAATRELLPT